MVFLDSAVVIWKEAPGRGNHCPATLTCWNDVGLTASGDAEIPGLTDEEKPRMRGPKRAARIRKLFNLTKEDDVRK